MVLEKYKIQIPFILIFSIMAFCANGQGGRLPNIGLGLVTNSLIQFLRFSTR